MRQHLNLGVDVKKKYKKLFQSIENVREVRVHSSSSRASIMSAISHNIGLFRNKKLMITKDLIFKNRHIQPLWFDSEIQKKPKENLTNFEREQTSVPLVVKEPRFDRMFLPKLYKVCPQAKTQLESIFDGFSKSYKDIGRNVYRSLTRRGLDPSYFEKEQVRSKVFHLSKKKNRVKRTVDKSTKWNFRNAALWYNVLQSDISWFGYPPEKITEEEVDNLKTVQSAYTFGILGNDEVRLLYTTEIASEIRDQILFHNDHAIKNHKKKTKPGFTLPPERVPLKYLAFSGGDFTLSSFLMAFDLVDSRCNIKKLMSTDSKNEPCIKSPDPAANIRIELTKKNLGQGLYPEFFVRTFYNNKRFKFCSNTEVEYCPIHNFIELFQMQTITNHEATICGAEDALFAPNSHFFVIIALLIFLIFWMRTKVVEDDEKKQIMKKYRYRHDPF